MKKHLFIAVAVLLAVAIAMPAFALEVKYGGLFYTRYQNSNNISDGHDTEDGLFDDNQNYFDERIRMFFQFISSENLRLVIGFEQDLLWGDNRRLIDLEGAIGERYTSKLLTDHRDTVGLELKHAYVDFAIPGTPTRAKVGLQPISLLTGWIIDEDFTGIMTTTNFDPVTVTLGYISENNSWVRGEDENVDDFALAVTYAQGPWTASLVGFYQYGHDQLDAQTNPLFNGQYDVRNAWWPSAAPFGNDDNLFDLGLTVSYKTDYFNVTANFVKNLGSFELPVTGDDDDDELSVDYTGWMAELIGNYFCGPWTFTLGGFYTSGDDDDDDDEFGFFVYPTGADHHWSEIMGLGSLDVTINAGGFAGATDVISTAATGGQYVAGKAPSNMFAINAGVAYQILEGTKLTLNYYYLGTSEDIHSNLDDVDDESSSIGHEFDVYVDQKIVDKLMLRLVGAYLFADDAYTVFEDDDDAYELGAVLRWSF